MSYVGSRQQHLSAWSLRGMITMGLCYVTMMTAITLLIIWSPLASPENDRPHSPFLMLLDQPQNPQVFHPVIHMAPDPQLHIETDLAAFDLPDLSQISTPSFSESQANQGAKTYNGRPIRPVKTMPMLVTAYSPDERSCGKWADGITASGFSVWTNAGKLVAADTHLLPFGTLLTIPGYNGGKPVPVLDRGGKIKGLRLDVLYPTHEIALRWGVQKLDITVWEYAD